MRGCALLRSGDAEQTERIFTFARANQAVHAIALRSHVLGVSKCGKYACRKREPTGPFVRSPRLGLVLRDQIPQGYFD